MLRIEEPGQVAWFVGGHREIGRFVVSGSVECPAHALAIDALIARWRRDWAEYREHGGKRPPDIVIEVES